MADRPFRNPLLARLDKTSHYAIGSAWEGLEYLLRYWRADKGVSYKIALYVCRDAVDGWASPERARKALKRALDDAGLSIPRPRKSPPRVRGSKFKDIRCHPVSSEQLALVRSFIIAGEHDACRASSRSDKTLSYQSEIGADDRGP